MSQVVTATCLGLEPTFGFGDPIGSATPGHVEAMRRAGVGRCRGVFARQTPAALATDGRTPDDVMDAAMEGLVGEGFGDIWGAEAAGLTSADGIQAAVEAGFRLFALDASASIDTEVDGLDEDGVDARYEAAGFDSVGWVEPYIDQTIELPSGSQISLDDLTCRRLALKFSGFIEQAVGLVDALAAACAEYKQPFEVNLVMDPGSGPATTIVEHYLVGDHLLRSADLEEKLVVVTPRLLADAEPGLDWAPGFPPAAEPLEEGEAPEPAEVPEALVDLEAHFADHAAIAAALGPYKLGLHRAGDKLSVLPAFGRATGGRCHVATSGATYLESLRVAAIEEPALFRRLVDAARAAAGDAGDAGDVASDLPDPADIADDDLEATYLQRFEDLAPGTGYTAPARRVLHRTAAAVLADAALAGELRELCDEFPGTFREGLADTFERHLNALFGPAR